MTRTTQCYEFQEPANIVAIRSNIIQRIKKHSSVSSQQQAKEQELHALDSGLPSPPCEPYDYSELMLSPTSTLPPSPTLSKASSAPHLESSDAIREKIRQLKQEKHVLFQTMKTLISHQPTKTVRNSRFRNHYNSRPNRYHYYPMFRRPSSQHQIFSFRQHRRYSYY